MISTERSPPWGRFSALMRAISSSSRLGWVAVKGDGAARAAASMMASNSPCSERWLARARWRRVSTTSSGAFLMERVTGMAPLWRRIGGGSRVVLGGWVESKNFHIATERRRDGETERRRDGETERRLKRGEEGFSQRDEARDGEGFLLPSVSASPCESWLSAVQARIAGDVAGAECPPPAPPASGSTAFTHRGYAVPGALCG